MKYSHQLIYFYKLALEALHAFLFKREQLGYKSLRLLLL